MIIAIDTETSGLDLRHRARPFFVTAVREDGVQTWWEWPLCPRTREVRADPADVAEITALVEAADELVGHNVKFDATALRAVGACPGGWPWGKTHDTTYLAHLVASNQPKDLTALALLYLAHDIGPLEERLGDAVKKARNYVKRKAFVERFGEWETAREDHPGLPSNGGKNTWRSDYWLPAALYAHAVEHELNDLPDGAEAWGGVLREYANADSAVTLPLYKVLRAEVARRGRLALYEERRKLLRVAYTMECNGLTIDRAAKTEMAARLVKERAEHAERCHAIARKYGHELVFPKGASPNDNVRTFCFDVLGLEPVRDSKAKTDAPSLNADTAIPYYLKTLPEGTDGGDFIRALVGKRARDTGLAFSASWDKYSLPVPGAGGYATIHATFNPASTDTIRFSSRHPNAQQIGKKDKDANGLPTVVMRKAFGPAPGREWWSLDFANIELRIPAYLSGERDLIDLFERADEPPFYGSEHLLNFSVVYPDIWEDAVRRVGINKAGPWVKEEYKGSWYGDVKNGDFAVGYLAGDETADKAFKRPGSRRRLKERFAKKEAAVAETLKFAERHGYVETIPDRTVDPTRGYPLMTSRTEYGKVKPTLPWSYKIQGTAGWVANRAATRCLELLDGWNRGPAGNKWKLIGYVHDELIFDFPKRADPRSDPKRSNAGRVREIKRLMERGGDDLVTPVRVVASVEYHPRNWGDGVGVKL